MLLTLGAGDLSPLLMQMQTAAFTSQLCPHTSAPEASRCLWWLGQHMEHEGDTAERDGTRNRTGGCWQG